MFGASTSTSASALSALSVRGLTEGSTLDDVLGDNESGDSASFRFVDLLANSDELALAAVSTHAVLMIDAWDDSASHRHETRVPLRHFGSSNDSKMQAILPTNVNLNASIYQMNTSPIQSPRNSGQGNDGDSSKSSNRDNDGHNSDSHGDLMEEKGLGRMPLGKDGTGDYSSYAGNSQLGLLTEGAAGQSSGPSLFTGKKAYSSLILFPSNFRASSRASAWVYSPSAESLLLVGGQNGKVVLASLTRNKCIGEVAIGNKSPAKESIAVPGKWGINPRIRSIAAGRVEQELVAIAENRNIHISSLDALTNLESQSQGEGGATANKFIARETVLSLDWSLHSASILAAGDASGCLQVVDKRISMRTLDSKVGGSLFREQAHDAHAAIRCVKWLCSPSQTPLLSSAGDDGAVRIWDIRRGFDRPLFCLRAHIGSSTCISSASFGSGAQRVDDELSVQYTSQMNGEDWEKPTSIFSSGGSDGVVRVWNINDIQNKPEMLMNSMKIPSGADGAGGSSSATNGAPNIPAPPPPPPPPPPPVSGLLNAMSTSAKPIGGRQASAHRLKSGIRHEASSAGGFGNLKKGISVGSGVGKLGDTSSASGVSNAAPGATGASASATGSGGIAGGVSIPGAAAVPDRTGVATGNVLFIPSVAVEVNKMWNVDTYIKSVESVRMSMHLEKHSRETGRMNNPFARKKVPPLPSPDGIVGIALFNGLMVALNAEGVLSRAMLM